MHAHTGGVFITDGDGQCGNLRQNRKTASTVPNVRCRWWSAARRRYCRQRSNGSWNIACARSACISAGTSPQPVTAELAAVYKRAYVTDAPATRKISGSHSRRPQGPSSGLGQRQHRRREARPPALLAEQPLDLGTNRNPLGAGEWVGANRASSRGTEMELIWIISTGKPLA